MNMIRKSMDKVVGFLVGFILAVMTILVTWQVVTRFVFSNPSTITEASAKYLFVWLVLIGAAYVVGKREHMAMEFFAEKFSQKVQGNFGIFIDLAIILFSAIVLFYGGGYIAINAMNQMDSALPIPVGVIYLGLPVCGVLSVIYSICNLVDTVKKINGIDMKAEG